MAGCKTQKCRVPLWLGWARLNISSPVTVVQRSDRWGLTADPRNNAVPVSKRLPGGTAQFQCLKAARSGTGATPVCSLVTFLLLSSSGSFRQDHPSSMNVYGQESGGFSGPGENRNMSGPDNRGRGRGGYERGGMSRGGRGGGRGGMG